MRKRLQNIMFEIGYILELIIAFVVGVSVLILSVRLLGQALSSSLFQDDNILVSILDKAMTLAIGVEFIKMLVKHTPETVIEVLAFAIAKQLVVMHTTPLENFITVVSIAVLFATRRFLMLSGDRIRMKKKIKKIIRILNLKRLKDKIKAAAKFCRSHFMYSFFYALRALFFLKHFFNLFNFKFRRRTDRYQC